MLNFIKKKVWKLDSKFNDDDSDYKFICEPEDGHCYKPSWRPSSPLMLKDNKKLYNNKMKRLKTTFAAKSKIHER